MLHKSLRFLMLLTAVAGLCGCETVRSWIPENFFTFNTRGTNGAATSADTAARIDMQTPRQPSSIVVCRSHQCAPAQLSMSKEYIYNSLLQLFDNNNYQKFLICEADSQAHTCLENYITLPVNVGIVPTNAYIDHAKITDVIIGRRNTINIILNYNLTYGGQVADCTPSKSLLFVKKVNHAILEDSGYNCKMTTIGVTNVKTILSIDYIDLDYGYIGGYYSIGLSGPAYGGGSGYLLLRLPKNAYPLSPALQAPRSMRRQTYANKTAGIPDNSEDSTSQNVQIFPLEKK